MRASRLFDEPLTRHRRYVTAPRTWIPGEIVNAGQMNGISATFKELEDIAIGAKFYNVWSMRKLEDPSASGVFVPLFTVATGVGMYWVRAGLGGISNDAANYGAYAHVFTDSGNPRIVPDNTPAMQIRVNGTAVEAMQQSGTAYPIRWVALRIS